MTYPQILDYLYNTLPMFSRMGSAAFKKDLTNIKLLCAHLHQPQTYFKTIHIGGTNGKGSVSHMLAAVLQTAGYKTGLYTSPHLNDFRERIKVNGKMAEEDFVVQFVQRMQPIIEEVQPSFFEITVAMAFEYFKQQAVDIAVIEVGLGGRLDSTNIIIPELSVITNIGWDHMNILGNTLEAIAGEKGGIIKDSVPVVVGEKQQETTNVFEAIAKEKSAPLFFAQDNFFVKHYNAAPDKLEIIIEDKVQHTEFYELDLPGLYQIKNIITVLQSIELLHKNGFEIDAAAVKKGLAQTKKITGLSGRWEVIHKNPMVILEVAHNEDGIRQMLQHLSQLQFHQLHIITGMVKDKEVEKVLQLLPQNANYYFTEATIPRALTKDALAEIAARQALKGSVYENVNDALKDALKKANAHDIIIICGSIFLVAEVDRDLLH